MEGRPLVIASVFTVIAFAFVATKTVLDMLTVPPMPREMKCAVLRNCPAPIVDGLPVAPLIAPRLGVTTSRPI